MSTPAGRVASIMKGKTLAESMLVLAKKELDQMRDMLANVKMVRTRSSHTHTASVTTYLRVSPPYAV